MNQSEQGCERSVAPHCTRQDELTSGVVDTGARDEVEHIEERSDGGLEHWVRQRVDVERRGVLVSMCRGKHVPGDAATMDRLIRSE